MAREIDLRTPQQRADADRQSALHAAAEEVSAALPGDQEVRVASFDPTTGNPAVVVSRGAQAATGDYVRRALQHVQQVSPALGFAPAQAPEYVADPDPQVTGSGAAAVHLKQQYKGIPIYDASQTVRFEPDGSLREVAGRSYTVDQDLPVTPSLTPVDALRTAAEYLARGDEDEPHKDPFGQTVAEPTVDLSTFAPVVRTVGQNSPDRVTTFDAPPFEHAVSVSLMWFPLDGSLRLAWHTRLQVYGGPAYRFLIDAADGRILLCRRLTRTLVGHAEVVMVAGAAPAAVTFPLPLDSYGAPVPTDLPAGFPDDWLLDGSTSGATVRSVNAEAGGTVVQGTVQGNQVVFTPPASAASPDRLVVNLFALCGAMHDVLYLFGFREADGNFQVDNHGRGGRATDAVLAQVHPGPVWGTANMGTPADGRAPTMNMGLVQSTGRHTAMDSDVVYHEYTHGLTNRLVGGPLDDTSLDDVQSGGMGEGWSDYMACTLLTKTVVGNWVVNDPAGIRQFPYDENFPDDFGDLGTGRYVNDNVHEIGEIWCATLMSLSRRIGVWVMAQIVVDALKLTAANPSFLAARDAILLAARHFSAARGDSAPETEAFVHSVWEVFARYGMGPNAQTNGPTLSGIKADFEPPPAPTATATVAASATPGLEIPDDNAVGIASDLTLPDAGPVHELNVTVDITHTYRGDLEVWLVAPDGRRVTLQSRMGGRAADLKTTWDSADNAGLAALRGMGPGGRWTLHVADRAPVDTGTLNSWSIAADVGETRRTVRTEVAPGLAIPDNKASGIRSEVSVNDDGTISALTLDVDITHTYVGDLEVTLRGPGKRNAKVHSRGGGTTDNLVATYTSQAEGPLALFVGTPVKGTWSLQVADRAGRDIGETQPLVVDSCAVALAMR